MGQRYVLDFQTEELNFIVFWMFLHPLVGGDVPPNLGGACPPDKGLKNTTLAAYSPPITLHPIRLNTVTLSVRRLSSALLTAAGR